MLCVLPKSLFEKKEQSKKFETRIVPSSALGQKYKSNFININYDVKDSVMH